MQPRNRELDASGGGSRREFMKKGALASSALALSLASSGTTAASSTAQQQPSQVLVFVYDYNPGISFEVTDRLQQGTVDGILGRSVGGDDGSPIVTDPADYNGYVVRYQPDQDAGEYALVFVREGTLDTERTYVLETDATFFNNEANLLTAGIGSVDGEETTTDEDGTTTEDGGETTTEEDDETTTEETATEEETAATDETADRETTEEVIVNGTTTTENGGGA